MFYRRQSTYAVLQQSVRNFGPKYVRNEIKSVRNFNVRKFWQVMYLIFYGERGPLKKLIRSWELISFINFWTQKLKKKTIESYFSWNLKRFILDPSAYGFGNARVSSGKLCAGVAKIWLFGPHRACSLIQPKLFASFISTLLRKSCAASVLELKNSVNGLKEFSGIQSSCGSCWEIPFNIPNQIKSNQIKLTGLLSFCSRKTEL